MQNLALGHRLGAFALALLLAAPLAALPTSSAPHASAAEILSHEDFAAGSWKMFHANPEHTGATASPVPPGGHVVWSYQNSLLATPEGGAAIDGGVVFAGLGRDMTALNASSGALLWSYRANSSIASTPALWNGTVYFGSDGGFGQWNFYALDASNGSVRWTASETPPSLGGGVQFIQSSPTVTNGLVYYGSFSYWLYARNASTGAFAWSANLTSEVRASPAESNGIVYAASAGVHNPVLPTWDTPPVLFAFNATTGAEIWNQTIVEGHLRASPVVAGDVVYAATAGFSYFATDVDAGFVLAFNATTGSPLWTSPDVGRMLATPAVSGTTMYVAGHGQQSAGITNTDARLRKLDLTSNGAVVWERSVGDNASIESSPAIAGIVGEYVVVVGLDGTMSVFLATGAPLWFLSLPRQVAAPVAVASEMVFVPSLNGTLYAIGAQPDLSVDASDITLSDTTPHAGQPLTLNVVVHNRGDKKGSGTVLADLNEGGIPTPIASWSVVDLGAFVGQSTLSAPLTFPSSGTGVVEVRIVNVTPSDSNVTNNMASGAFAVLPAFDGWLSRYSDGRSSNFLETETPQNNILLWKQDAFDVAEGGFVAFGPSVVFADKAMNRLVAVERADGNNVTWVWDAPAAIVGTPSLAGGHIVVVTADPSDATGNVTFIDPDTGAAVSSVALAGRPTTSGAPYGNDVILGMTDKLVEISVVNFSVERELPTVDVPPADRPALRLEPVVLPGWAFAVSSVGELHAFNLTTGSEPAGWPVQLAGPTTIPPVAGSGYLFVVNGADTISAFALSPLTPTPGWSATFSEPISGALAVGYGRLFIPTPSNITALVAGSGVHVWNHTMAPVQPANAIRAAGNNTVFAGSERLFALSSTTGDVAWIFEPGTSGPLNHSAALYGGTLHLQTQTGGVLTLGLIPGRPPDAVLAAPVAGRTYRTREAIVFSAEGTSDPDNQTLEITWDFGDGNFGTGLLTNHTYAFAGDFRVRLTVTDEVNLSSVRFADIHVVENRAPTLFPPTDHVQPSVTGRINLDTTVWTFKVRYIDPDNDPPATIVLNVSNETEPSKPLVPAVPGPYDFSVGVDYLWIGTLTSGRHAYSFSASDGLDSDETPTYPAFNVFRIENRSALPLTYSVEYVGQGSSLVSSVTGLAGPPGLGVVHVFSITLPQNASLVQWIDIYFRYDLSVNTSDYDESTIRIYWFDEDPLAPSWVEEPSTVSEGNHTVAANITRGSVFVTHPEGLTATLGIFGEPKIPPQSPIAVVDAGGRSIFSPTETILFSAAQSVDRNDNNLSNLTFVWDFGDGTAFESGLFVNHTYNRTGNFDVKLTVTNNFGQNDTATYSVTIRTEASESAFLGIAAAIVAGLFLVFVLWPVFRRRGRGGSPPPPAKPRPDWERRERPKSPRIAPGPPPKPKAREVAPSDEEAQVVEEIDGEFESGLANKGGN